MQTVGCHWYRSQSSFSYIHRMGRKRKYAYSSSPSPERESSFGEQFDPDEISLMPREYQFGIDCILTLMKGPEPPWNPRINPYISGRPDSEVDLCTENIVCAIHFVVGDEISAAIDVTFSEWFQDGKNELSYHGYKILMNLLVIEYLDQPYTARRLLEVCCTVAEISILLYIADVKASLDYGAICIFFCVLQTIKDNRSDGFDVFKDLDSFACRIRLSHRSNSFDPVDKLLRNRQRVLSYSGVRYYPNSVLVYPLE